MLKATHTANAPLPPPKKVRKTAAGLNRLATLQLRVGILMHEPFILLCEVTAAGALFVLHTSTCMSRHTEKAGRRHVLVHPSNKDPQSHIKKREVPCCSGSKADQEQQGQDTYTRLRQAKPQQHKQGLTGCSKSRYTTTCSRQAWPQQKIAKHSAAQQGLLQPRRIGIFHHTSCASSWKLTPVADLAANCRRAGMQKGCGRLQPPAS